MYMKCMWNDSCDKIWSNIHMQESCYTYECVMSPIWMSHVTHMYMKWLVRHDSVICVTYLIHVWHDSFILLTEEIRLKIYGSSDFFVRFSWKLFWVTGTPCTRLQTWLKIWRLPTKRVWYVRGLPWKRVWYVQRLPGNFGSHNDFKSDLLSSWRDMTRSYMWHDSYIHVTCLTHVCDRTHSYVWHDSCDMAHSFLWYDSFMRVTWLIHMCDMTRSHVWHDAFICVTGLMHAASYTYEWVMPHTWMSHVTHVKESCHTYDYVMSHTWMGHGTQMNESRHTHGWVMSYTWMGHVPTLNLAS